MNDNKLLLVTTAVEPRYQLSVFPSYLKIVLSIWMLQKFWTCNIFKGIQFKLFQIKANYTLLFKMFKKIFLINFSTSNIIYFNKLNMYLFDLTKINCSIYLTVKSLYYILELCNIKYFICDLVSVTKKLRPNHAK